MSVFEEFKGRQRAIWSAGDWPEVAPTIQDASDQVVERAGVSEGHEVLDVATGSGNAAIRAAERGAKVAGIDFVASSIEAARHRAAEAGLEIDFREGDAENLEFPDDSFDRVLSVFGAMFAPRHEKAAAEMLRVTRPGGLIAVANWTPEGANGQMFATLGKYMPPPPPEIRPPILWGVEEHVRSLFEPLGGTVTCERRHIIMEDEATMDEQMDRLEVELGPFVLAKAALEPQGRWGEAREELKELFKTFGEGDDDAFRIRNEFLLTVVQLPQ